MEGCGRIAIQIGKKGFYAEVSVFCRDTSGLVVPVAISPQADDSWQRSQGWIDAALSGAALGLKLAHASSDCTITRVKGMICDTCSTLIAIAALQAVWNAVAFSPDEVLSRKLQACIVRCSEITPEKLEDELTH